MMKTRINTPLLMPPSESIGNMLRVSAEITIEFIMQVGLRWGGECWQVIKDVLRGR